MEKPSYLKIEQINKTLVCLRLGTQGVEPCQLKDQIGVYHVLYYAAGYTVTFPYRGALYSSAT